MDATLDPAVGAHLAAVVGQRIGLWRAVEDLQRGPTAAVELADGTWSARVEESVGWLGEDARRFRDPLARLEAVAAAEPPGDDLERARVDLAMPDISTILTSLEGERRAWREGDAARARMVRAAQHDEFRAVSAPLLGWCSGADGQRECPALAAAVPVVLLTLSIETGRDFEARFRPRFDVLATLRGN